MEGGPSYSSGSTAPSASTAPGPNTRKASEASGTHLGFFITTRKRSFRGLNRQPVLSKERFFYFFQIKRAILS